jgi:hypothetical protein
MVGFSVSLSRELEGGDASGFCLADQVVQGQGDD